MIKFQENPGKGDKPSIKEEVSHDVQKNYIIDDDIKPEPRRRAATASQVTFLAFFLKAKLFYNLGRSVRPYVTDGSFR